MLKLKDSSHKLDSVFLLLLFTLFTAAAIIVVITGSDQYSSITNADRHDSEVRSATSYIREKTRQQGENSSISITGLDGTPAIAIEDNIKGINCTTYIYCYNGWLCELFVSDSSVYSAEAGKKIIQLQNMEIQTKSATLLQINLTDSDGEIHTLYINTTNEPGKEYAS